MLSLFSVSGSSSVHIAISENFHAKSHIIGLFSVSLFPGTQNTVMSLLFPFSFSRNVNVFSRASGVCAKSTKYVAPLISCFWSLQLTHWKDYVDLRIFSMSKPISIPTAIAARILFTL